jgi:acetoin utilization deacetylase AcuC-like enzyme
LGSHWTIYDVRVPVTVFTHPDVLLHDPPGGHPERPARIPAALEGARSAGVELDERLAEPVADEDLLRIHPEGYVEAIEAACREGGWLDADTYASPPTERAFRLAAGGAVASTRGVLAGEIEAGFACLRPPGHHALATRPMGFCLVNNVAIAARAAQAAGAPRVAIVDWDVHHGNGTQAIFWRDPTVLVVSLQQWPLWPGSGSEQERGEGPGEGATLNLCLPPGTAPEQYLARFEAEVLPAVRRFAPDLVLVSCGFDTHRDDPLGSLLLESTTYGTMTSALVALSQERGIPRPVVLLEGGYDLDAIRESTGAVVGALAG